MKRSEMVEIISEFLDKHVELDTAYAWKYSKESAGNLLSILEGEGIAPPMIVNPYLSEDCGGPLKHTFTHEQDENHPDHGKPYYIHKWEKEDETE